MPARTKKLLRYPREPAKGKSSGEGSQLHVTE